MRNVRAGRDIGPRSQRGITVTPTGAHAVSDVVPEVPARRAIPFARIGIGCAALIALVLIGREAGGYVPRFAQWVEALVANVHPADWVNLRATPIEAPP